MWIPGFLLLARMLLMGRCYDLESGIEQSCRGAWGLAKVADEARAVRCDMEDYCRRDVFHKPLKRRKTLSTGLTWGTSR